MQIGFTVSKTPPERKYVSLFTSAPTDAKRFAIPPNNPNWVSPPAEVTFATDVELVYMMPHMHVRGKDMWVVVPAGLGNERYSLRTRDSEDAPNKIARFGLLAGSIIVFTPPLASAGRNEAQNLVSRSCST